MYKPVFQFANEESETLCFPVFQLAVGECSWESGCALALNPGQGLDAKARTASQLESLSCRCHGSMDTKLPHVCLCLEKPSDLLMPSSSNQWFVWLKHI
jgi:hypothetical protein